MKILKEGSEVSSQSSHLQWLSKPQRVPLIHHPLPKLGVLQPAAWVCRWKIPFDPEVFLGEAVVGLEILNDAVIIDLQATISIEHSEELVLHGSSLWPNYINNPIETGLQGQKDAVLAIFEGRSEDHLSCLVGNDDHLTLKFGAWLKALISEAFSV
jgi:hypothetical protein